MRHNGVAKVSIALIIIVLILVAYTEFVLANDLNGDGVVDGVDLAMLLSQWGACGRVCPADLNKDKVVNGVDLAILLSMWTPSQTTIPLTACGTLNQEGTYVLQNDIVSSQTECLTIATDGVTVDGNGHRIKGGSGFHDYGIKINAGDFTLRDAIIEGFDWGIISYNQQGGLIEDNEFINNAATVEFNSVDGYLIRNNYVDSLDIFFEGASAFGIGLFAGSNNNKVEGNTILGGGSHAVYIVNSSYNKVENNHAQFAGTYLIGLYFSSEYNDIRDNYLNGSAGGFVIFSSDHNTVENNEISNAVAQGFNFFGGDYNKIISNNIHSNLETGVKVKGGRFNLFKDNYIHHNGFAGINIGANSYNSTLEGNIIDSNFIGLIFQQGWDNNITNNTISNSTEGGIEFWANDAGNIFTNTKVISSGTYDLNFYGPGTQFVDTYVNTYILGECTQGCEPAIISFEETQFGKIIFPGGLFGQGSELFLDVNIEYNLAIIDDSANQFLDQPAQITLRGLHAFSTPKVYDGNDLCVSCEILSSAGGEVIFTAPGAGVYSIGN